MKPGKKKSNPLISPFVPIVGVGVTALGFMLLRPGTEARARQLYHSGRYAEALRMIREERADGEKDVSGRLSTLEMEVLAELFRRADAPVQRRLWTEAFDIRAVANPPYNGSDPLMVMTGALKDPSGLWELRRNAITAPGMRMVREAMIARLLATGNPAGAAALLAACPPETDEDAEIARRLRLADYYRQSANPAAALAVVEGIPEAKYTAATRELRIALLRESGKAREALALILKNLEGRDLSAKEVADIGTLALAAGDAAAADPFFRRYLAAHPEDVKTRRFHSELLANMGLAGAAADELKLAIKGTVPDRADLERLAQLYGWAGNVIGLQDALLRLAISGDRDALAKLTKISGLPEDDALPAKLADAVSEKGREAELIPAAEFLASIGDYDLSVRLYRRHLARRPDDLAALSACALILFETGAPAEALPLLKHAVELAPKDIPLRQRYAETLMNEGRGDEALAQYGVVAQRQPDVENLGVVRRLAQSLGRTDIAADAADRRLAPDLKPAPEDFVIAQNLAKSAGRDARATEILKAAVAKFPADRNLRLYLATRLSDNTDHLAALNVMRLHPGLKTDAEAAGLWLDLMRLNDAREDERAYFADGGPAILTTSAALRMRAARALSAIGRYPEALAIQKALVEEIPGDRNLLREYLSTLALAGDRKECLRLLREKLDDNSPESLRMAANIYAENADYKSAERKVVALLAQPGENTTDNWSMLGDFRISRGDTRGAKQAYATAYAVLTGRTGRSK